MANFSASDWLAVGAVPGDRRTLWKLKRTLRFCPLSAPSPRGAVEFDRQQQKPDLASCFVINVAPDCFMDKFADTATGTTLPTGLGLRQSHANGRGDRLRSQPAWHAPVPFLAGIN